MSAFLNDWAEGCLDMLLASAPWFLVGLVAAGAIHEYLPTHWVRRVLGGHGPAAILRAALVGAPLPLCSCSVLPTAAALRRSGASRGATGAFLVSTPETGVDSIGVTWALFDPLTTVFRPLAAVGTACLAGLWIERGSRGADGDTDEDGGSPPGAADPASAVDDGCGTSTCAAAGTGSGAGADPCGAGACAVDPAAAAPCGDAPADPVPGEPHGGARIGARPVRALRWVLGPLLDDLAPWFAAGVLLSGLLLAALPLDALAAPALGGLAGMALMLLVGLPTYVCASASTPLAAALVARGLEPGAALVLLLAGPATNLATLSVVRGLLGRRALLAYLAAIALGALASGALLQALHDALDLDLRVRTLGTLSEHAGAGTWLAAGTLALLLLPGTLRALRRRLPRSGSAAPPRDPRATRGGSPPGDAGDRG